MTNYQPPHHPTLTIPPNPTDINPPPQPPFPPPASPAPPAEIKSSTRPSQPDPRKVPPASANHTSRNFFFHTCGASSQACSGAAHPAVSRAEHCPPVDAAAAADGDRSSSGLRPGAGSWRGKEGVGALGACGSVGGICGSCVDAAE